MSPQASIGAKIITWFLIMLLVHDSLNVPFMNLEWWNTLSNLALILIGIFRQFISDS